MKPLCLHLASDEKSLLTLKSMSSWSSQTSRVKVSSRASLCEWAARQTKQVAGLHHISPTAEFGTHLKLAMRNLRSRLVIGGSHPIPPQTLASLGQGRSNPLLKLRGLQCRGLLFDIFQMWVWRDGCNWNKDIKSWFTRFWYTLVGGFWKWDVHLWRLMSSRKLTQTLPDWLRCICSGSRVRWSESRSLFFPLLAERLWGSYIIVLCLSFLTYTGTCS